VHFYTETLHISTKKLPLSCSCVHVMSDRVFTCSLDNAKQSFYRTFNSLFGKIGRIASEDVIVQLVKTKCLPVQGTREDQRRNSGSPQALGRPLTNVNS